MPSNSQAPKASQLFSLSKPNYRTPLSRYLNPKTFKRQPPRPPPPPPPPPSNLMRGSRALEVQASDGTRADFATDDSDLNELTGRGEGSGFRVQGIAHLFIVQFLVPDATLRAPPLKSIFFSGYFETYQLCQSSSLMAGVLSFLVGVQYRFPWKPHQTLQHSMPMWQLL